MVSIQIKKIFTKRALPISLFSLSILVVLLLAAVTTFAQSSGSPTKIIAIEGGKIAGLVLGENKDVQAFKGIPYAKPPLGPLRWKPPQPVEAWKGIRLSYEYGPACPQPDIWKAMNIDFGTQSEDCLYLNVWTAAKSANEKRPVMMWIHGGGNISGASQTPANDGEALARQGVVVVSINYRLGIFGYFAHPLLSKESLHKVSGNYGLLDQIAALKWIRKNIKAFGGDPGNVTVFGESAGAINVCYLMASPFAKGLFHRAIAESGNALGPRSSRHLGEPWYAIEPMEKQGERLAKDLGCSEASDPLAALRALSAEKLLEGSKATMGFTPGNTFGPVVDGWVLPDDIKAIFDGGRQNLVSLIVGSNADEGTIFIPKPPFDNVEAYRGYVQKTYGKFANDILTMYPANEPSEIRKAMCDILGDSAFVVGARDFARAMTKAGSNAYLYHYTMKWPGPAASLGAFHTAEMVFAFDTVKLYKNTRNVPFEEKHQSLANAMSAYWVQFAKTGNPNKKDLLKWPAYDPTKDQYVEFGEVVKLDQGLRKKKLDLWDDVIADRRKNR